MIHQPVLLKEVLKIFNPKPNQNFIDATLGEGSHSIEILKKTAPKGKILGIEFDPVLIKEAKKNFKKFNLEKRIIFVNDNFSNLEKIIKKNNFFNFEGILFDLGISKWHFKKSKRGFSFQKNEVLDLRINPKFQTLKGFEILNLWQEPEIEKILREFGEIKRAKEIARDIVRKRKIKPIISTFDLIKILENFSKFLRRKNQKIHFATKVFMALRIAVNNEIENLKEGLNQAFKVLKVNKKIVVISFHSLEDRIVKNFFKELKQKKLVKVLTKKPIVPSIEEIQKNPSARSAKLRAIEIQNKNYKLQINSNFQNKVKSKIKYQKSK